MSDDSILKYLKSFNWQKIINLVPSLVDLNDFQWRFIKGYIIELAIEETSNKELIYVAEKHRDFIWPSKNLNVELKSQTSDKFYKKNGTLKETFSFKFTNSNGTNNKSKLSEDIICDFAILIKQDGVAYISKEKILKNLIQTGDGFILKGNKDDIVEVSGCMMPTSSIQVDFKGIVQNAIDEAVRELLSRL